MRTTTNKALPLMNECSAVYRKINWRLLPFLVLCYVFAYMDRINIGFAKLQMQQDIGIDDAVYGLAAGIFFIGYMLFEVPSNLLLLKIGTRKTLSRIMVLWGVTSASMLFVHDAWSFYILRFLLGVFEAGFAPGVIFYLTYWYSKARMARAMSILMCAGPIGGIISGPLSTWVMTAFSGAYGLKGWQWMFLIEGLPCVALGIVTFFYLTDKPTQAKWLSPHEKKLLAADITPPCVAPLSFRQILKDKHVYVMALSYFCLICGIYAVSFWLPTILKSAGVTDTMKIGLYSTIPYIAAMIAMIVFGRSSDRSGERRWHSAILGFLSALAMFVAAMMSDNFMISMLSITFATAFMWASYTVFWAMPSDYLKGNAAAGGIALINSIGLFGGFLSPFIIGYIKKETGSLNAGLLMIVGLLLIGCLTMVLNRLPAARVRA